MKLKINGEEHETEIVILSDLLSELEYEGGWLATAVNGELVHREDRVGFCLKDGDRIEVLAPMQGG